MLLDPSRNWQNRAHIFFRINYQQLFPTDVSFVFSNAIAFGNIGVINGLSLKMMQLERLPAVFIFLKPRVVISKENPIFRTIQTKQIFRLRW